MENLRVFFDEACEVWKDQLIEAVIFQCGVIDDFKIAMYFTQGTHLPGGR